MRGLLRSVLAALCILVASGLVFLLLLDYAIMPFIVEVPMVTIPDVRNLSAGEARRRVAARGLRLALRDSVYSETELPGQIVEQSPKPGDRIKRARRVFVDVSLGTRLYTVPAVTGGSQREARLQIASHQLAVGRIAFVSSNAIPEGVVIRQRPAAGERVQRDARVDLDISSGSPLSPKPIPNLVGLSIETVEDSLHKYEMALGQVEERIADLVPPGQVLVQRPESGDLAPRGTSVSVVVSVGRQSPPQPGPVGR